MLRELRTMFFDPLFSPLFSTPGTETITGDESEGAPHSVQRSIRTANTYWRHYRDNAILRAAVNEIVNALISIPLIADIYEPDANAWEPLPPTDRLATLMASPSLSMSPAMFYTRYWTELTVLGNNYLWKHRNNLNEVDEFHQVDSRHMRPEAGTDKAIEKFIFAPSMWIGTGEAAVAEMFLQRPDDREYDPSEIIFTMMSPDPTYPLMGLSPVASALRDIDLDNGITTFMTSIMERGAVHDWALVTKEPMPEPEARRIERRWFRRRSGPQNAGGLVVVDGTVADLKQLGMSIGPRDMGLMDLRKQVEARILMVANVPPIVVGAVLGIENATYSNYQQARMAMHEENSDPMLSRACSAFEWSLRGEFPEHRGKLIRIRADLSHVWALLDSVDKRNRLAIAEFEAGMTTQPEARGAVDRPPLADVDPFYLVPANYAAQPIIPGQSNVPVTSGDQSNNGNANAADTKPAPAGESELRTLARSIAANYRVDVMRRLSARAQRWGLDGVMADHVAFESLYADSKLDDGASATARAHRLFVSVDEMAGRKA